MKIERVLAPNPGLFTGPGTNTYVLSDSSLAIVLDPGPVIDVHIEAIEIALGGLDPIAVMVTHTHRDHAPAANILGQTLGVEVLGYAPGPEFEPTRMLTNGQVVTLGEVDVVAIHTPGHTADHLCYRIADVVFSGDHVMGGSTVVIEDAAAYMQSLKLMAGVRPAHLYPGHGSRIDDVSVAITEYINHRIEREYEIVAAVRSGAVTSEDITEVVYAGVDPMLQAAAQRQVQVQLVKLVEEGRLETSDDGLSIPST